MAARNDKAAMKEYKAKWARDNRARLAEARSKAQKKYRAKPEVKAALQAYNHSWHVGHYEPSQYNPLPQFWPYDAVGYPLEQVNAFVPRGLPEYLRSDICQELCLAILAGECTPDNMGEVYRRAVRETYGNWAVSLDWRREDGYAIADRALRVDGWEEDVEDMLDAIAQGGLNK